MLVRLALYGRANQNARWPKIVVDKRSQTCSTRMPGNVASQDARRQTVKQLLNRSRRGGWPWG